MMLTNPPKPISRYPSIRSPVFSSTVCTNSSGPPNAYAVLILLVPFFGIGR